VFLQVLDPQAFAGRADFVRQTDELARRCHASRPAHPGRPVRLPGEQGFARKAMQQAEGVALHPGVMGALRPWAEKLKVAVPGAVGH
jgi:L-lactate dehydrogenase